MVFFILKNQGTIHNHITSFKPRHCFHRTGFFSKKSLRIIQNEAQKSFACEIQKPEAATGGVILKKGVLKKSHKISKKTYVPGSLFK